METTMMGKAYRVWGLRFTDLGSGLLGFEGFGVEV